MARVKKPDPTLEAAMFSTPEQKVIRLLLGEPTTSFSLRAIASRLKGVRGLGGIEGITEVLEGWEKLGFVDFVDNRRGARLRDEHPTAILLKQLAAVCDLEALKPALAELAKVAILFGSRASGRYSSDSDYDLFVVSNRPDEVREICGQHPLGKNIEVLVWSEDDYSGIEKADSRLAEKLARGITLWSARW